MRKLLLLFILCFSTLNIHAQWISQASGFPTPNRGIDQIFIVDQNIAWTSSYDGTPNVTPDTVQDFTMTTDGGNTWTAGIVSAAPSYYAWSCIAAISSTT